MNAALIAWVASWCMSPDICTVEQEQDVAIIEWYTNSHKPQQRDLGWINVDKDEKFRIFIDIKNNQWDMDQSI